MLQNTLLGQALDQAMDQVSEQEPLLLAAWEQDDRAAPVAGPVPPRRAAPDLYAVAVVLLLLLSFAAILACFAELN